MRLKHDTRIRNAARAFLYLTIALMLLTLGVVVYWYFFSENWGAIVTEVPEGLIGIEPKTEDLDRKESSLYSEKFNEATSILGTIPLSDYLVVIDISEQREYIFTRKGAFVTKYRVSTGSNHVKSGTEVNAEGVEVPVYQDRSMGQSIWRVKEKRDSNLNALYGPRMMYLERLIGGKWTSTDVALHGTNEPDLLGTPTSVGCVNHDNADIIELYDMLEVGALVVSIW